jgi:hypothetical protein
MHPEIGKIKLFLIIIIIPCIALSQQPLKENQSSDSVKQNTNKGGKFQQSQNRRTDTVVLFDGDQLYINVMKITYDSLVYTEAGESALKKIDKDKVHKIRYNWGRLEILNEKQPKILTRYNWRKVKILGSKNETEGLYMVDKVVAKAEGSSRGYDTPKSLENRAEVILKKKAANLNAKYVLITGKNITIAFGEIPSATIKGIIYSDKKPDPKHK